MVGPRENEVRTVKAQHIQRHDPFVPPSTTAYWLVLVSCEPALSTMEMRRLATQILETPVRWIAAWGCASRLWEDALDGEIEWRMAHGTCPVSATTTAHDDDEPLAEVIARLRDVAGLNGGCAADVHVLVIGGTTEDLNMLVRGGEDGGDGTVEPDQA